MLNLYVFKVKDTKECISRNSQQICKKMAIDFEAMLKQAEQSLQDSLKVQAKEPEAFVDVDNIPCTDLYDFKLTENGFPKTAFYVPNFVSNEESSRLVKFLSDNEWVQLKDRKLKNYGGAPNLTGTILEPLPLPLQQLSKKLVNFKVFESEPDQALVNQYDSTGGIGYHNDGPNFKPKAAIISLLSSCLIHFRKIINNDKGEQILAPECHSIMLEPNSLFVFTSDLYVQYKHGINCNPEGKETLTKENKEPLHITRKQRFSITLRNVSKIKYKMSSIDEILPLYLQEERERGLRWWKKAING